jgi:hypothetical protein
MGSNDVPVLLRSMRKNPLDQVVAVLVAGDVDQRDARTVRTAFTDAVQVAREELRSSDLEALLNDLGRELIHAVLGRVADDVVDGTAAIGGSAMLADVLDAPVAELTMGDDVDVCQDLLNARTLRPQVSDNNGS